MARKRIKVSTRMIFTWLALGGLILLFCPQNITGRLHFTFTRIFQWPLGFGRTISLSARTSVPSGSDDARKDTRYENLLANLSQQLADAYAQVNHLSGLRARLPLEAARLVNASIITASTTGPRCELVINRGSYDGVAAEQFVLADNSIIGTVSSVDYYQSRVRLFTDPSSKIEVKIGTSSIERLMQGNGQNKAKILMVSRQYKVNTGDKVFVRRKPGLLDCPMIIGTVSRCKKDDQKPLLWDITVAPACNLEELGTVDVISMNPKIQPGK